MLVCRVADILFLFVPVRQVFLGVGAALLSLTALVVPVFSQTAENAGSFDVASIKRAPAGSHSELKISPGGRVVGNNFSLKTLIGIAYHLQAFQMSGGDGWISDDRWNIAATAEGVTTIPVWSAPNIPEVIAVRLRALLEDRFQLETHRETRTQRVYVLTSSRNFSKLKVADPGQLVTDASNPPVPSRPGAEPTPPPGQLMVGPGLIVGSAVTMGRVIIVLNRLMDGPIIDKTDLKDRYNVRLKFDPKSAPRPAPEAPPIGGPAFEPTLSDDPSIFAAIQQQMGLKLESMKEPVEVLVIDSAQKPTAN